MDVREQDFEALSPNRGSYEIHSNGDDSSAEHRNETTPLLNDTFTEGNDFYGNPEMGHLTALDVNRDSKLGWIAGVFCPVTLSMFSTLLFLRMGYIVGNAGLLLSIGTLILAYGILGITVLSISTIASNESTCAGGTYHMISRTLGHTLGASVGVLFLGANVFASALYATGCVEGAINSFSQIPFFEEHFPTGKWDCYGYASIINIVNLGICLIGARFYAQVVMVVLCVVVFCGLSIGASFFQNYHIELQFNNTVCNNGLNCSIHMVNGSFYGLGTGQEILSSNLYPTFFRDCENPNTPVSFATVFGVLFSGVTGIMAGVNMSSDLRHPRSAIPKGTLRGCAFTGIAYAILFVLTALTCNQDLLYNDCQYMARISFSKWIVAVGTILTTFCASTSSLIGASRVLSALARDKCFGQFGSWLETETGNPYTAVVFTYAGVQVVLISGSLNDIAQICSLFFLLSYLCVNMACLGLEWAKAPSFHPTFRYYHRFTCCAGILASVIMMIVLSPSRTINALVILSFLSTAFNYAGTEPMYWGSISQGIMFHMVRKYFFKLRSDKMSMKYWRPKILLLVGNARKSCGLMDFTDALKKSGMFFLGHVSLTNLDELSSYEQKEDEEKYQKLIAHLKIKAVAELTIAAKLRHGIQNLICLAGMGEMKPNTVMIGFPRGSDPEFDELAQSKYSAPEFDHLFPDMNERPSPLTSIEFLDILCDILRFEKNLIIHRHFQNLEHAKLFPVSRHGKMTKPECPVCLDVWLVDFFSAPNTELATPCHTFGLTLVNLVTRVSRWKHLTMRVFIRLSQDSEELEQEGLKTRLGTLLEKIRVNVAYQGIYFEANPAQPMPQPLCQGKHPFDIKTISDNYMEAMNEKILAESSDTAVTVIALARPPYQRRNPELDERYIQLLRTLTNGLPPTLLIHGKDSVVHC